MEVIRLRGLHYSGNFALGICSFYYYVKFMGAISTLLPLEFELVITLSLLVREFFFKETLDEDANCTPFLSACIHLVQLE